MIVFRNNGQLDIRAIKTFGLSSKNGDDTIGRFGTGLKYATAVIARAGGAMTISTGGETFVIGARDEAFRDRQVRQITMNGEDLPFTADLGRDWEVWMAFRELYSNALDEGGVVERHEANPVATEDETIIAVDLAAFEAIFFSMEEHFIGADELPIWKGASIQVFAGRSAFVFYRGIAVMKLKEPAAYRYNLLGSVDLTEDRTAKYDWQVRSRIASAMAACSEEAIATAAADQRNVFEASLDFSITTPSEVFLGASVKLGVNCNPTAMAAVRAQLPPDEAIATVYSSENPDAKWLPDALAALRRAGADLSKVKFVLARGVQIFGDLDVRGDKVFLSETIFGSREKMIRACFRGYDEATGGRWILNSFIALHDQDGEQQAA